MGLLSNILGPQGLVGYYGLTDWWAELFTRQETDALEKAYARRQRSSVAAQRASTQGTARPLGLTRGVAQGYKTDRSAARFLAGLAPLVGQVAPDREPAVWAKAEELALESGDLIDLHVVYSGAVKAFYARREEDREYLDAALEAAVELVSMADDVAAVYRSRRPQRSLPPHAGYKLLAALAERRGDVEEALSLSRRALEQGWAGDWPERIARLEGTAASDAPQGRAAGADGADAPGDGPAGGAAQPPSRRPSGGADRSPTEGSARRPERPPTEGE